MSKHSLLVVSYFTGAIIVIRILCHITPSVFKGAFSLKEGNKG